MGWRFLAQRLDGNGGGRLFDVAVPLQGVQITTVLSGPDQLSASITPEFASLKGPDGRLLLEQWSTALYAERNGNIYFGGIVTNNPATDAALTVECVGFCGYPTGMPYTDSIFMVDVDPLDVVRHIWAHLQAQEGGDIGMRVSDTQTPLRIGKELEQASFDPEGPGAGLGPVTFEAGPVRLAWYMTQDVGGEIDKLAEQTPFDWTERHFWEGNNIVHQMDLHYPRAGRRRHDLQFVVGANIVQAPEITNLGDTYGNQVLLLGAGEGRDMIRGQALVRDGRLRRVVVTTDKSARTPIKAFSGAQRSLREVQSTGSVSSIVVMDSPAAPIGSWAVGDDIFIESDLGWATIHAWHRILSYTISPDSGDTATLTVAASEVVT